MAKHLAEPDENQPRAPIWRTKIALSAALMLAVVVMTIFGFRWLITERSGTQDTTFAVNNNEPEPRDTDQKPDAGTDPDMIEDAPLNTEQVIVHVAGEVHEPGIVELSADARVVDAIEAAGGATEQAHVDALNLAAVATDGDYILIPDREEAAANLEQAAEVPGSASNTDSGTVNINTGDAAALETLPGIGPATAEQIIAHRDQHGSFTDLTSLEEVSGIGPATRERLDGLVSW